MNANARIVANRPSVIFDVQDDQAVLIDLESGHYFQLDAASTALWTCLAEPTTPESVASACDNRDDLDGSFSTIIDDLLARGLIRPARPEDGPDASIEPWHFDGFELAEFTDLADILGLDPIHEVDPKLGWPHVAG